MEIHNEEISSIIVNPSEAPPSAHDSSTETAHTSQENPILEVPITDEHLNKFHRQLVFTVVGNIKRKPTVTKPFDTHTRTSVQISENNLADDVVSTIKEFVHPKIKTAILIHPPLRMYDIIPVIQSNFKSSAMNLVLATTEVENIKEYLRQQEIIQSYHDGKTNHRGINECFLALSKKYYWPKMREQITKFINNCTICGRAKYDRNPIKQQFNVVPPATKPLEIIHLDLFTTENEKYLTIIDVFSKYAQAYHLRDGTALSIIRSFLHFCTHHGLPLTVVTDNGTEFTNQLFSEFTQLHKINHHKTLPHTPNDNGNIERFHSTLLEHLRILKLMQKDEPAANLIPYAILAYNSSVHSFTKCRPYDLINGHFDPRDPFCIDLTKHLLQQYSQQHRDQMKIAYDFINETSLANRSTLIDNRNKDREPEIQYEPNQQVFIKNPIADRQKLAPRYTQDTVLANLPIHIYTSKKRNPIAKSRLKRVPKSSKLLQDPVDSDHPVNNGSSGDKT